MNGFLRPRSGFRKYGSFIGSRAGRIVGATEGRVVLDRLEDALVPLAVPRVKASAELLFDAFGTGPALAGGFRVSAQRRDARESGLAVRNNECVLPRSSCAAGACV